MKFVRSVFCLMLIAVLMLFYTGCTPNNPTTQSTSDTISTNNSTGDRIDTQIVNWQFHGAVISEQAELGNPVQFSIQGKLPLSQERYTSVTSELDIIWPENFQIENVGNTTYIGYSNAFENSPLFWYSGYCINQHSKEPVQQNIYIFPEDELVIFHWSNSKDGYLIASTDPNADLSQLFRNFQPLLGIENASE